MWTRYCLKSKRSAQDVKKLANAAIINIQSQIIKTNQVVIPQIKTGCRQYPRTHKHTRAATKMAKLSPTRRLLILANVFNLLVAIYFIIIAIVGLVQLRWYHQLTVAVKARFFITLATSYFAFFILILVSLILIGLFISSTLALVNPAAHRQELIFPVDDDHEAINRAENQLQQSQPQPQPQPQQDNNNDNSRPRPAASSSRLILRQSSISDESQASVCCSIFLHSLVSVGLILILIIWLYNTGELARDSISSQLDYALARYQFSNRTNYLTIAVDGIQEINTCCGSLDYTDFPRQRNNGLSLSHYPGSCCGKHVFAAQARVICMADEVVRSKRTIGCTIILANYYDLLSLMIVPVALVCLFANITIVALITISRGGNIGLGHHQETPSTLTTATSLSGRERRRTNKLQ